MAQRIGEVLSFLVLAVFCKATSAMPSTWRASLPHEEASYCLSWRLAVEANNVRPWRTVPTHCLGYIETYMIGGQYFRDLDFIMDQILSYANEIILSGDGMDAWILDVDDTCISNVIYYGGKRYGYVVLTSLLLNLIIQIKIIPLINQLLCIHAGATHMTQRGLTHGRREEGAQRFPRR
jgi:hypothetical protein